MIVQCGVTTSPDSILALTSELPWPLDRGGHLRTFHLLRALAARFHVRLVAGILGPADARDAFSRAGITLLTAEVGSRTRAGEAWRVARAAVRSEPYVLYRRHDRRAMWRALREALTTERPSLLYLDHLDSLLFAPVAPSLPKVLDLHNVYSTLTGRVAIEAAGIRRLYLERESRLLARVEERAMHVSDAVFAVSEEDQQYFRQRGPAPVYLIPNGVDCRAYAEIPTLPRTGSPLVLFIGSLGWNPNAAAARYLIQDVFPEIRSHIADARLRIIGRDAPPDLLALSSPGVDVLTDVADVRPHLAQADVIAVALEAGGGSRLKILEAFAAGVPVVSTAVGCEGLAVTSDRHLIIAPRERMADAVIRLLNDPARARLLAQEARRLVAREYDWSAIGSRASEAVAAVLKADSSGAPHQIDQTV